MKILLLGADGFIGRHLAFGLRAAGAEVIASARAPGRLAAMGFQVLAADLTDPAAHAPAFWAPHLAGGVHVVNCAGPLTDSEAAFRAVHLAAPVAVATGQPLPARALRLYRIWFALGWPAFLGLAAVFWLMVAKPNFGV